MTPAVTTVGARVVEPVDAGGPEPDLIDRIAGALPEEVRAEYYRELLHCRSLPENDEMLRLLRAMQFLVLLIEQAPSRIAEEREHLDKLLATTIASMTKINAASETHHATLQRKITRLPNEIANGISPEAIAARINENLRQEFTRSSIPGIAETLAAIAEKMKASTTEFSATSDSLGSVYRGAAEDARKAIASLNTEMAQATATSARLISELTEKFSKAYRLSLVMLAFGALIIGLAIGMMFERFLFSPPERALQPVAPVVQTAPPPAPAAAASGAKPPTTPPR